MELLEVNVPTVAVPVAPPVTPFVRAENSLRVVRIGLVGLGGIGQGVARLVDETGPALASAGLLLEVTAALVRDREKPRDARGIALVTDPDRFPLHRLDVLVEATGGIEPARTLIARALVSGLPVVTANKRLVAAHGPELCALASKSGTPFLFEAAVVAGVPFLGALARRPLAAGPGRLNGILNATSHVILSAMEGGRTFDEALADAVARGYAEPASDRDTSGEDAADKLAILLHLSGWPTLDVADLPRLALDRVAPAHLRLARLLGGCLKPVAIAATSASGPGAWVGPAFVPSAHPFASLSGVTSALEIGTPARHAYFSGPGAGAAATSASVLDDVVEAIEGSPLPPRVAWKAGAGRAPVAAFRTPPPSRWWIAIRGAGTRLTDADLAEYLASGRIAAVGIARDGNDVAARTVLAPHGLVRDACEALAAATGADVLALPVLEGVAGA